MPTETLIVQSEQDKPTSMLSKFKRGFDFFVNSKAEADRQLDSMSFSDAELEEYESSRKKGGKNMNGPPSIELDASEAVNVSKKERPVVVPKDVETSGSNGVVPLPSTFAGQEDTSDQVFKEQFKESQMKRDKEVKIQTSVFEIRKSDNLSER